MEHVLDLLIQDHSPRWEIREAASRKTVAIQTVVRRPGIYGNRSCILDNRAVLFMLIMMRAHMARLIVRVPSPHALRGIAFHWAPDSPHPASGSE